MSVTLIRSLAGGSTSLEIIPTEIFKSLEQRGLIEFHAVEEGETVRILVDTTDTFTGIRLTDYGKAFAAWLMEPRETPTNRQLPI